MQIPNDITARKHKGNQSSVEANTRVEPTKVVMRQKIYEWAKSINNFTMKEACRAFNKFPNEISGRLSEMKGLKLIEEANEPRRDGCSVLRVVQVGQQMKMF